MPSNKTKLDVIYLMKTYFQLLAAELLVRTLLQNITNTIRLSHLDDPKI